MAAATLGTIDLTPSTAQKIRRIHTAQQYKQQRCNGDLDRISQN